MENKIPFFGLSMEYKYYQKEYKKIFDKVMKHGKVLQGEEIKIFENKIANLVNRKYAVAVNSATDALYFALLAFGIKPGDEVLVTNFSFIATASCIVRAGAIPVFCDIEMDSYHTTVEHLERMYSKKCKAIIYPHLFGNMKDTTEIEDFAKSHNIVLIEDAAQSLGSMIGEKKAGSIGDCSCISFDPTKVIGAPGSGGVFLCNNQEKAELVKMLRYHGKNKNGEFEIMGFNSQMPSLTAEILNFKLSHLKDWEKKRQEIADFYNQHLSKLPIKTPAPESNVNHIYHKYVIRVKDKKSRDNLVRYLLDNNVEVMVHYKLPLSENKLFKNYKIKVQKLDVVQFVCDTVLSLPIHPWLKDTQVEKIANLIKNFCHSMSSI